MESIIIKYQTHIVELLRNIKNPITYNEVVLLLSYKDALQSNREQVKNQILTYFNWTESHFNKINCSDLSKIYEYITAIDFTIRCKKEIHAFNELSTEFKDSLGLPPHDIGLDVIALDKSLAIQCKHRANGSTIPFAELKKSDWCNMHISRKTGIKMDLTFVTPENVKLSSYLDQHYTYNHHVINTARVLEIIRSLAMFKEGTDIQFNNNPYFDITLKPNYDSTNNIGFINQNNTENLWTIDRETQFTWRKCQLEAYDLIVKTIDNNFIIEKTNDDEEVEDNANIKESLNIKMVCGSGKTDLIASTVKYIILKDKKALILVPRLMLLEQISECFKSHNINHTLIGNGYDNIISNITVCVYNSINKVKENQWDYLIIDEAHHIENRKINETDDLTYTDLIVNLTNQINTIKFSASLNEGHYEYNLRQAIDDKVLVDYQLHVPYYENGTYNEAVINYLNMHPEYTSIIGFCNRIENCQTYKTLLEQHNYKCRIITGSHSKKERNQILNDFRNGMFQILLSVNVLSEGINLPYVNTVMFLEERQAKINVLQCMLRCLRLYKQKTIGHIILPCINYNNITESNMLKIIRVIVSNDKKLMDTLINRKESHILKIEKIKTILIVENNHNNDNMIFKMYEKIYDSHLQLTTCDDKLYKQIKLLKEYHSITGNMIKSRASLIYNGEYISGNILRKIKTNMKNGKYDKILNEIKEIYVELYEWYVNSKNKCNNDIILFTVKLLALQDFYNIYKRLMKRLDNHEYIYNGIIYNIDGKIIDTLKQSLKKGVHNDKIDDIKIMCPCLYEWYIKNKDKHNKEVLPLEIKLLAQQDYYDKYNCMIPDRHIYEYLYDNKNYEVTGRMVAYIRTSKVKTNNIPIDELWMIFNICPCILKWYINDIGLYMILKTLSNFYTINNYEITENDKYSYTENGKTCNISGFYLKYLKTYKHTLKPEEIALIQQMYPSILV